jgi:mRNA-degrading endonuclease YafQ of YafQ-DinJ toxin-antitoxin module
VYKKARNKEFDKEYNKLQGAIFEEAKKAMEEVLKNPTCGDLKNRALTGLWTKSFVHVKTEFRIIYIYRECCKTAPCAHSDQEVDECEGAVMFFYVITRERANHYYQRGKMQDALLDNMEDFLST